MEPNITASKIFSKPESIVVPEEAIQDIKKVLSQSKEILCVYSSNAKALYFFSVQPPVFKIRILIYPLNPEIVAKIMSKVSEVANKILYSTGLCLIENKCYWEGYIQHKDLLVSKDLIPEIFKQIDEIQAIEIFEV